MHLNPYGEYAVRLAQSLANDWPPDRAGVVARTRDYGMTMPFPEQPGDRARSRNVVEQWLAVVDAHDTNDRAVLLNQQMATVSAYPRLTDHNGEGWHLHYRDVDDDLLVARNGTQRYCSPRCASRDAVRRHRARGPARQG